MFFCMYSFFSHSFVRSFNLIFFHPSQYALNVHSGKEISQCHIDSEIIPCYFSQLLLGDPEVTANTYLLQITQPSQYADTQNYSTDLR